MKKNQIYLFQGDSITDGNRSYVNDSNHILGHGYVCEVAMRMGAEHPAEMPHFYNRGIHGNSAYQLLKRWQSDAIDLKPDHLSLLIGANDCGNFCAPENDPEVTAEIRRQTSLENYDRCIRRCLTDSRQANPNLEILLGLPFFYPVSETDDRFHTPGDEQQRAFTRKIWQMSQPNAAEKVKDMALRREIVRKIAADFSAVVIDCDAIFRAAFRRAPVWYWCWDGVHPTMVGHHLLAEAWLKELDAK